MIKNCSKKIWKIYLKTYEFTNTQSPHEVSLQCYRSNQSRKTASCRRKTPSKIRYWSNCTKDPSRTYGSFFEAQAISGTRTYGYLTFLRCNRSSWRYEWQRCWTSDAHTRTNSWELYGFSWKILESDRYLKSRSLLQ